MARPEVGLRYSVPFARVGERTGETEVPNFSTALLNGEAILVGGKFVLEYARIAAKGKKKGYKGKVLLITDPKDKVFIGRGRTTPEQIEVSSAAATSSPIIRTFSNNSFALEIGDYKIIITEVITSYEGGGFALKIDSPAPFTFKKVGWHAKVPGLREILRRRLEQAPAEK
ncbi:MAG: hypothetical protein M1444_03775 [Patescibacteria group bacterium]|nr:hypothetical protein [Patescibacteria group bacterium]